MGRRLAYRLDCDHPRRAGYGVAGAPDRRNAFARASHESSYRLLLERYRARLEKGERENSREFAIGGELPTNKDLWLALTVCGEGGLEFGAALELTGTYGPQMRTNSPTQNCSPLMSPQAGGSGRRNLTN